MDYFRFFSWTLVSPRQPAGLVPEASLVTEYSSITHSSWDYELSKNAGPYELKVPLLSYKGPDHFEEETILGIPLS